MQLPQPQLDTIDREFIEQSYQESFRQRFQQLRFPSGSDVEDTLSHFRVVDRVNKIIGQSCRFQSTVQFQIDGEGLRASAFIVRHATAARNSNCLMTICPPMPYCRRWDFRLSSEEGRWIVRRQMRR